MLNVNGAHGNLFGECGGKKIVEDFKSCILNKSDSFIRGINLKSYKQETHLNRFQKFQMILPEDGSLGVKRIKPTFHLDPLFVYLFCLFDKDFLLYFVNPLIVPRSCMKIRQNSTFTPIVMKVGMIFRIRFKDTQGISSQLD